MNGLTIGEIVSRSVAVEWYEAVAVVRDAADRLIATPALAGKAPDLDEVRLTPAGAIEVLGSSRTDEPVRRVAQLLQALVTPADAPVQLRLLISQATAPTPTFKSISEFSDALAYFERPQRALILGRLYTRAADAPLATEPLTPTLDMLAPLPASSQAPPAKARNKSYRRHWRLAAAAVLVAIGSGAAVQYVRMRGIARGTRERLTVTAAHVSNRIGGAVLSGASSVTDLLGLGRVVPGDRPASAPTAPPAPAIRRAKHVAAVRAQSVPVLAFDLEPGAGLPRTVANAATTGNETTSAADAVPHLEPVALDDATYDVNSEGVVPPVAIRPELPRQLPPSTNADNLSRIELLVDVDGTVASVKLRAHAPTVLDTMLLSAVKAWQFEPALKDGARVKYRKTIWILNP